MMLILKLLKWTAIAAAGLIAILFSLSYILKDDVIAVFLKSVNSKLSTKIEVGTYTLSLLKKFPKASVELKNMFVLSSPSFDKSQFTGINTDTLLKAESAFLEFSMRDLIKGNYKIESISLTNGNLNLFSDSSGKVNYEITSGKSESSDEQFVINLEKIRLTGLKIRYANTATKLNICGLIETGRIKSRIAGDNIDFICSSSLRINTFDLYSTHLKPNASVFADLNLHQSDSGILFKKGSVKLENFNFDLAGFISSGDVLDLRISGKNIDIAHLKKFLPEEYRNKFMEYSPSGIFRTDCLIKGPVSRTVNPGIVLICSLENGQIEYAKSGISIKDLSFSGGFTNGEKNSPESSIFEIKDFRFTLGSAVYKGGFKLSDFVRPEIEMTFSGEIIASEFLSFFTLPEITGADGSFRINMKLGGRIVRKEKYFLSDFIDLNPEANLQFSSFGLKFRNNSLSVEDVDGNIMFAKNLWAEELVVSYLGQRFRINGELTNFPAWLSGRPVQIRATADITADNLYPELFMRDTVLSESDVKRAYQLPRGIEMQISFRADSLIYKTFSAGNFYGILNYYPGVLNIDTFNINALSGNISGNGFLAQNRSKSFISRGSFAFEDIDVNKAFRAFKNFGQDFIVAENIAGSLSGSLSLLMPLDSLLLPDAKSVTAEGKYTLVNGSLLNFEPVKELSDFIELSELENIRFSKLENDLFIKNNYLAVPQMDIKSSAADFTVSGKHNFDNYYEYHVKTYLSEVLSKKARRDRKNASEFGAIEDDGLGRTSVFLKITGNDEDVKVTYDLKAAGGSIKQNLKNEKGSLKNLLNEEFGWFKRDSSLKQQPAPKPKFRIEWSENDTVNTRKDTSDLRKDSGISRIFKKKKKPD